VGGGDKLPPTPPSSVFSKPTQMGGLFAYLDAGSGSMIVQAIVGGVAAVAVAGKFYWRRFLGFIGIRRKNDS
jgi:hypothetical protein